MHGGRASICDDRASRRSECACTCMYSPSWENKRTRVPGRYPFSLILQSIIVPEKSLYISFNVVIFSDTWYPDFVDMKPNLSPETGRYNPRPQQWSATDTGLRAAECHRVHGAKGSRHIVFYIVHSTSGQQFKLLSPASFTFSIPP